LANLIHIDETLANRVAKGLGISDPITPLEAKVVAHDMRPSPALSLLAKAKPTLEGRKIGCLITDGADAKLVAALQAAAKMAKAKLQFVAPKIGGVTLSDGQMLAADHRIDGGPSVIFDAAVILVSAEGGADMANEAAATDWLRDAYGHLKVIAFTGEARPLFAKGGLADAMEAGDDAGLIALAKAADFAGFTDTASKGRIWAREPKVRKPL
jgi:catalase